MANKKFNIGFISSHGHAVEGHIVDLAANPDLESIHLCVMNDKDANQRDLDINKVAKASEKVKTKTKNIYRKMMIAWKFFSKCKKKRSQNRKKFLNL